jgi:hypothetical protein
VFKNREITEKASGENTNRYVNILIWWEAGLFKELLNFMEYGI